MAGLLKYFCHESKQKLPVLSDPKDNLSEKVPSSSIEFMNNIVHDTLDEKDHEGFLSLFRREEYHHRRQHPILTYIHGSHAP